MEIIEPLTEKEFEKIVQVQTEFFEKENPLFEKYYTVAVSKLSPEFQQQTEQFYDFMKNRVQDKIKEWRDTKIYEEGFSRIKNVYMLLNFKAFYPAIVERYSNRNKFDLEYGLDPERFNGFIQKHYGIKIEKFFDDMAESYHKYRIMLHKQKLTDLMGYPEFNPDRKRDSWGGMPKSILIELVEYCKIFKNNDYTRARDTLIKKLIKENKTNDYISEECQKAGYVKGVSPGNIYNLRKQFFKERVM